MLKNRNKKNKHIYIYKVEDSYIYIYISIQFYCKKLINWYDNENGSVISFIFYFIFIQNGSVTLTTQ